MVNNIKSNGRKFMFACRFSVLHCFQVTKINTSGLFGHASFLFCSKDSWYFFLNFFKEREIGFNLVEQIVIKGRAWNLWMQGASTTCYAALSPQIEGVSGKYFADCNESNCSALANDESEAKKLWKQTRALIHRRLRQPSLKHLWLICSHL